MRTNHIYPEIMVLIDKYNKNIKYIDNQFEYLITYDLQLQDLEGGMEVGELRVGDGVDLEL